jgi:hypothetical protein
MLHASGGRGKRRAVVDLRFVNSFLRQKTVRFDTLN